MTNQHTLTRSSFHFIGVGGIGMSALAELLSNMGAKVTGSDLRSNDQTQRLQGLGVKVFRGHEAQNVDHCDVVVYSSAVQSDNPEILAAKEQGIPQIPRAEALAEIMNLKRGIAVGGTHGKTTTTSLLASIFIHGGYQPTIAVGGRLDLIQSTALLGSGEWMIAEADESDGSFSRLNHELCVITNVDNDHLEHYGSFDRLKQAFFEFAMKVPFYGTAIVCGDDPVVRSLFESANKRVLYYGFNEANDYVLVGAGGHYQVKAHDGAVLGKMTLKIPGRHNALNAMAAAITAQQAGIPWKKAFEGLEQFDGVDRRFQYRGDVKEAKVYDDYGHHPTEIRAVVQAFKEKYPDQKLHALFQPHRFSRTQTCWGEFTESFEGVEKTYLLDIYSAGEQPLEDVTSDRLSQELKGTEALYVKDFMGAKEKLVEGLSPGDVLVCLGAGDIYKFYEYLKVES